MAAACALYKIIHSELCSRCSHKPYEPYQSLSCVFISNKTVSVARDLHWSATPASR